MILYSRFLIPFLMVLLLVSTGHCEDLTWQELNDKVTGHYQQQQFTTAAGYAEEALELAKKHPGNNEQLATSLNNLAMIYTHLGRFGEAEGFNKEALSVRQRAFGVDDVRVAVSWNNLGLIYYFHKKMEDAEFCFQEVLRIQVKAHGDRSEEIIPALQKLEKFYTKTEQKEKAEKINARIQDIQTGPEA
ncbi:MAG: tetratricopeptide repeat protein [Thermodesulfobacteriota bacterium]